MKKIYESFIGGLSDSDRQGPSNSYYIGREVDPYRYKGYIAPGWTPTNLSGVALVTNQIVGITDIAYTAGQVGCYGIDDGGQSGGTSARVYAFNTDTDTVTNDASFPHDINNEIGRGVVLYEAKKASASGIRLFYITDGDVGRYDFDGNFDDDFMSTSAAVAGVAGGFSSSDAGNEPHPHLKWNGNLWIGDGRYICKYDGQTGDGGEGTWNNQALDLDANWHTTALFPTRDYIGICATERKGLGANPTEDKYRARSKVFFWDGTSSTFAYSVPVGDNVIRAAVNNNEIVQLFTSGRQSAGTLKMLNNEGAITIKFLKHDIAGTDTNFDTPPAGAVDIYKGRTIFGSNDQNVLMSYGRELVGEPFALTFPWADYSTSASQVGAVRTVNEDKIYAAYKKGTTYLISNFNSGNSANAQYKGLYTDLGQRAIINYVKFYFQPLASGDNITPTLDVEYGTSVTLKDKRGNSNISFTNDGATTSKKMFVDSADNKKGFHSFRPVIDWTAGDVAISKIVIDYSFVDDV